MNRDNAISWAWAFIAVVLATLVSFALAGGEAHAGAPTLVEKIVAVVPSLANKKDETVDAQELAEALIATSADRQWIALELAVMANESALAARIARGEYRDKEADAYRKKDGTIAHRAWGLGQLHANRLNESVWGSIDVRVQVAETHKALRRGFYGCGAAKDGKLRPDWIQRTINCFAGHSADAVWPGLERRVATFNRVKARL